MNLCNHFAIRCHFVVCSFRLFIVFPVLSLIHSNEAKLVLTGASVITAIVLQFIDSWNSNPFSQKEKFTPQKMLMYIFHFRLSNKHQAVNFSIVSSRPPLFL